jgi:hypothetical protein
MKVIIPKPSGFYSELDEKHFFLWLDEMPRLMKVVATPAGLELTFKGTLDFKILGDLIVLMSRYKLDMKCMREYCLAANKEYFYDKERDWFDSMFSDSQETKQGQQDEAVQSHP